MQKLHRLIHRFYTKICTCIQKILSKLEHKRCKVVSKAGSRLIKILKGLHPSHPPQWAFHPHDLLSLKEFGKHLDVILHRVSDFSNLYSQALHCLHLYPVSISCRYILAFPSLMNPRNL